MALRDWAPAMWSMWAWVTTICLTVRWWRASAARMMGDVVAGVYDDGFAGGFVAEDGAVAADWADRKGLADHGVFL